MNNDAEAIKQLFSWLLHEPNPASLEPSGDGASREASSDESGIFDSQPIYDSLDSNGTSFVSTDLDESSSLPFRQISSLEFGEIPAVQDRFQALLKRRLRTEIERNPPRFPWEVGSFDYDSEYSDSPLSDLVPVSFWTAQLQTLKLPVPVPAHVLRQLFEQCCTVVQSSLQDGAKLVQVVEALFPGHRQNLNQLAGLVLSAAPRSGASSLTSPEQAEALGFPSHYDVATPTQQMALSLLAAKEILNAMTLTLSPSQPKVDRNWLTDEGTLKLEVECLFEQRQIHIQGTFPHQGRVSFYSDDRLIAQSTDQAAQISQLTVELPTLELNHVYRLDVQPGASEQPPLIFAVVLVAES